MLGIDECIKYFEGLEIKLNNISDPQPLFTVIVPTLNHERYIEQALMSVISQSIFPRCTVIVSDDGSSDRTPEIIESIVKHYDNIHFMQSQTASGVIPHYRRLLELVSTDYFSILEGDDVWISDDRLMKCMQFLNRFPEQECVFTGYHLIDENGKAFATRPSFLQQERSGWLFFEDLLIENHIGSFSNCSYRTDSFKSILFSPDAALGFDWYINLVLASRASIGFVSGELGAYRVHNGGTWSKMNPQKKADGVKMTLDILRKSVSPRLQAIIDVEVTRLDRLEVM